MKIEPKIIDGSVEKNSLHNMSGEETIESEEITSALDYLQSLEDYPITDEPCFTATDIGRATIGTPTPQKLDAEKVDLEAEFETRGNRMAEELDIFFGGDDGR